MRVLLFDWFLIVAYEDIDVTILEALCGEAVEVEVSGWGRRVVIECFYWVRLRLWEVTLLVARDLD